MRRLFVVLAMLSLVPSVPAAHGAVEKVTIRSRAPLAEGTPFGATGAYEKITARVSYVLDPKDPANAGIVDLDLAPKGEDGKIRFEGDLVILRPTGAGKGNGALLVEVPNRGGKALLRVFDRDAEASNDPTTASHLGDGFLLAQGFTVAWVGWQFDLPEEPDLVGLGAPPVGTPTTGLVRVDHVFGADGITELHLGHRGHRAYPAANLDDPSSALTMREYRFGRRLKIPRDQWRFARIENGREVPDPTRILLPSGFLKGKIYELVYRATDPVVAGVGLTAVRDAVAHLRHDPASPTPGLKRTLGLGISQTGRFLRQFLYEGRNRDERGRTVFDGAFIHAAGAGRGSFNHRFAQPSRDAQPYSSFFYPIDLFPYSDGVQVDRRVGRSDGLLRKLRETGGAPKIFFTNSAYDYWGRAASALHTTVDGQSDLPPGEGVRIYSFAGAQHFVGQFPPRPIDTLSPENPLDFRWSLRALLLALDAWVATGKEPPPSRYPTIAAGELVTTDGMSPDIVLPVPIPREPKDYWKLDFGPRFESAGIIDQEPPRLGEGFRGLVFQMDADGNDRGGLRLPELAVPLATLTGWNWRAPETGAATEVADFRGSFLPFPWTAEAARAAKDARQLVLKRYPDRKAYLKAYRAAAEALVKEGYLRKEDLAGIVRRGEELWDLLAPPVLDTPLDPVEFLGEVRIATGVRIAGAEVGGLSALVFEPASGLFHALSDDPAEHGPARLYRFQLEFTAGRLAPDGLVWKGMTVLEDVAGAAFAPKSVDPEGLALDPTGGFLVSSEGQVLAGVAPFLRRYDAQGAVRGAFELPAEVLPGPNHGIRHNRGGEGLARTPDGRHLFLAMEGPLTQDGPDPTPAAGALARVYRYDLVSGRLERAFLVPLEPVHAAAKVAGELEVSGISGLVALDADTLLILERSFARGAGHGIRLARVDLRDASDVSRVPGLAGLDEPTRAALRPARRTAVLDLETLGLPLDNLEGLAFGPTLPDGRRVLVIVSDNNFSAEQFTQILAFAVGRADAGGEGVRENREGLKSLANEDGP